MKTRIVSILVFALLLVSIAPINAQDETTCEDGFRLFDHEYLAGDPLCIPENPQRVLALEVAALETVLFTDMELVGTASWLHDEIPVIVPELAPALEGIANTGYPANLEVALTLEPDIILAVDGDIDVEAGSAIAPVVMVAAEYDWKIMMEFWSEVLGTQELYDEMIANYETRIAELQDAIEGDPEVSIVGTSSYGAYLWLEDTAPGYVLSDAGIARPESQALSGEAATERYGAERWISITEESFDLADGDAIFVFTYATTDPDVLATENAAMEEFQNNPVWNTLSAVQADQVYYVGPYWWRSQTYLMANLVIDDLFANLTDSEASTPTLSIARETTSSDSAFPMTIEHELGTTTLEAIPERIVVLEYSYADHLGTLGIAPVGFAVDAPSEYIYAYTSDVGAVEVGTRAEPNLEVIVELEPDFIIADLQRHEAIYDQLSLIAPTVVFNSLRGSYDDQLEQFSTIAAVVDKDAEAAEILAAYQEDFDSALATTSPDAGNFIIGVLWSGGFTAHSNESFMGSFLESLGRSNALEVRDGETQYLLDMEGLASVNPATIVVLCNAADQQILDDLTGDPLWQAFDAASNNRVYVFDRNLWSKGRGVTAYGMILEDAVNSGLLSDTESQSTECIG